MIHHNIVNLLDVGVEGEYRYLVLEYVNGHTLKDIIRQKGRLNPQTAIQIAINTRSSVSTRTKKASFTAISNPKTSSSATMDM